MGEKYTIIKKRDKHLFLTVTPHLTHDQLRSSLYIGLVRSVTYHMPQLT
jgi:hypothetical protein